MRRRPSPRRAFGDVDRRLLRYCVAVPASPRANRALDALGAAADDGLLWTALSCAMATHAGTWRRAAVRAMLSVATTSLAIHVCVKPVRHRRRPRSVLARGIRRSASTPRSSSFPSGHAASAAAVVTAMAMERTGLGLAVAPLAAAVAYSRLHTGVHWPSDVLGGIVLGVAGALAIRCLWAPKPATAPACVRPRRPTRRSHRHAWLSCATRTIAAWHRRTPPTGHATR
ncbi:undecaprenyl-diphosphatase [Saccharopolyspora erythraea NRRL 2338]|uniref:Phosphoesterase, PA-phosphatase related n=2 Tax=Saccharopolyspora erythraea TaxID=1836 RepID=A4FEY2_SACEN|nr:phosphatase PAP2 family protein [Saccharopolyspora erythraea]EQD82777.1 PA-phosphatase [Saccharopolyspora erythraea D]PFG96333.1 undecaprenyl-diphosphatase [Saccharopolyspora erythraea NRRL 2338]QRK92848.1 phosphatase PAP2 family protein [Saccharopolyspora erythraea]CAM02607.1 phosphoesterase, PA-phosphatase related [Saccharopolyspora erythraea NRRL 2338]